jgi:hypothetical protein
MATNTISLLSANATSIASSLADCTGDLLPLYGTITATYYVVSISSNYFPHRESWSAAWSRSR